MIEGGPQGEDLPARLELDAPHYHPLFARAIAVVEGIASTECLRKQFWVLFAPLGQIPAILSHVVHILLILCFILKRHADMLAATGWGLLLHLCVFHHSTVWSIFALPSPWFFRSSVNHKIR
jgi:hypothetical protein